MAVGAAARNLSGEVRRNPKAMTAAPTAMASWAAVKANTSEAAVMAGAGSSAFSSRCWARTTSQGSSTVVIKRIRVQAPTAARAAATMARTQPSKKPRVWSNSSSTMKIGPIAPRIPITTMTTATAPASMLSTAPPASARAWAAAWSRWAASALALSSFGGERLGVAVGAVCSTAFWPSAWAWALKAEASAASWS